MGEDEGNTSFALFAWGFLFIGFSNISLVLQWELNEYMQPHEAMVMLLCSARH